MNTKVSALTITDCYNAAITIKQSQPATPFEVAFAGWYNGLTLPQRVAVSYDAALAKFAEGWTKGTTNDNTTS